MKIVVLAVGPIRGPFSPAAVEFGRRARRYWKLDEIEVPSGAKGSAPSAEAVRSAEGKRLVARMPHGLDRVALTRSGQSMDSHEMARWLERHAVAGAPGIAFIVGGAFGLADAVIESATRCLSLSSLTLPHDLARVTLLEQLYRAGTILRGEPYHKG